MSTHPDLFAMAHAALSASTTTEGEIAVWYCASARLAFTRAAEEMKSLEAVLVAREHELARVAEPKQLAIAGSSK